MTLAAGALFGPWLGVPLAVASGVAGATIAMLVARHVVARRGRGALSAHLTAWLDGGARRSRRRAPVRGPRLTPVMPFALVNVAAGLSRMPARTFAARLGRGRSAAGGDLRFAGATLGAAGSPGRPSRRRALARPAWRSRAQRPRPDALRRAHSPPQRDRTARLVSAALRRDWRRHAASVYTSLLGGAANQRRRIFGDISCRNLKRRFWTPSRRPPICGRFRRATSPRSPTNCAPRRSAPCRSPAAISAPASASSN